MTSSIWSTKGHAKSWHKHQGVSETPKNADVIFEQPLKYILFSSSHRKQDKEMIQAEKDQDEKLLKKLKVKKLEVLLQQVSLNKNNEEDDVPSIKTDWNYQKYIEPHL